MTQFNIYYGSIGNTLKVKYHFTKKYKSEEDALKDAYNRACSMYYKNEGKYGLPSYEQIADEANITDLSIKTLYQDHINDMMRWYAIPTELDTVTNLIY